MGLGGTTRSAQAFSTFSASFFGVFGIEMVSSYLFTSIVSPSRRALGFCVRLRSMRAPLAPRRSCSATALFRTISACSYAPLFSSVSLFGGIHRCFATNRGCGGDHCTSRSARGPARVLLRFLRERSEARLAADVDTLGRRRRRRVHLQGRHRSLRSGSRPHRGVPQLPCRR